MLGNWPSCSLQRPLLRPLSSLPPAVRLMFGIGAPLCLALGSTASVGGRGGLHLPSPTPALGTTLSAWGSGHGRQRAGAACPAPPASGSSVPCTEPGPDPHAQSQTSSAWPQAGRTGGQLMRPALRRREAKGGERHGQEPLRRLEEERRAGPPREVGAPRQLGRAPGHLGKPSPEALPGGSRDLS